MPLVAQLGLFRDRFPALMPQSDVEQVYETAQWFHGTSLNLCGCLGNLDSGHRMYLTIGENGREYRACALCVELLCVFRLDDGSILDGRGAPT